MTQGTVRRFDPQLHSGEVIMDDGTLLEFGPEAFDRSDLRLLRVGQRVRLELEGGTVRLVTIVTF